jgi:hypothetical protein
MGQGQGVLIQSCSLLFGRDYIVLLVFSYLLDVNQRTSRNSVYTSGDVNDERWHLVQCGRPGPQKSASSSTRKLTFAVLYSGVAPGGHPNLCFPWVTDLRALLPGVEAGGDDA